jgi:acyl carrier protein
MDHLTVIRSFVLTEFLPGVDPRELDNSDDLLATGVMDSLGVLKLIAWVEHHFGLTVDDEALDPDNFRSVDAVDEFLRTATPVG